MKKTEKDAKKATYVVIKEKVPSWSDGGSMRTVYRVLDSNGLKSLYKTRREAMDLAWELALMSKPEVVVTVQRIMILHSFKRVDNQVVRIDWVDKKGGRYGK